MEMSLEKYFGFNFHTWKVKSQMQLINKSLWGIVKWTEQARRDLVKLLKWKNNMIKPKPSLALLS
jgi:hypothetical protein